MALIGQMALEAAERAAEVFQNSDAQPLASIMLLVPSPIRYSSGEGYINRCDNVSTRFSTAQARRLVPFASTSPIHMTIADTRGSS